MALTETETHCQPFVKALVAQIRARDSYGVWDGKDDAELLEPFLIDKEKARLIPIIGDPDPDTLDRVEQFYSAVGLSVEQHCGKVAAPIMQITPEGFGRMVLTCGRLVVINKVLRDIHRFGFASPEALANAGNTLIAEALDWIGRYPALTDA
ncbi:MAG: NifX-associated nitrogen fixation protein [Rhizomicrobium sp.]